MQLDKQVRKSLRRNGSYYGRTIAKENRRSVTSFALPENRHNNIKKPKLPEKPPWHQKPCITNSNLTNGVKKDENPELLKCLALAKIESYSNSVHIYTDASITADNKTAAAHCIPKISIENSFRLNNNITIFTAELMALKLALLWITNTLDEDVTIFSDL